MHATTVHTRIAPSIRWLLPSLMLLVAAGLRLWQIGSKPGWEWDESSYTFIGRNVAENGAIQSAVEYGHEASTFLFHPPFYFLLLGRWFELVGVGVTQARLLSVIMSLFAMLLLYVLTLQVVNRHAALVVLAFLAIDPWMIYANRTSWMENTLIVLLAAAMLLYWRAIKRSATTAFVIAGVAIGAAVIFKHTAAYLLIAAAVYCLINRDLFKKHLALLAGTVGIVFAYIAGMSIVYGGEFWSTNRHQLLRTLGSSSVNKSGNGSIRGFEGLIEPLVGQYRVFVATLIIASIAGVWWLGRVIQVAFARSFEPVRKNAFAFAWMTGGILGFAAVQLKYPSYFEVILIAAYVYLACEVTQLLRQQDGRKAAKRFVVISMAVLTGLCAAGFYWRIAALSDNAIKAVGEYARTSIPTNAVVLTEQPIGNLIEQPFCDIRSHVEQCGDVAAYVITYTSANYPGPDNDRLREIMANSTKIWSDTGFKETLTVYRVNQP